MRGLGIARLPRIRRRRRARGGQPDSDIPTRSLPAQHVVYASQDTDLPGIGRAPLPAYACLVITFSPFASARWFFPIAAPHARVARPDRTPAAAGRALRAFLCADFGSYPHWDSVSLGIRLAKSIGELAAPRMGIATSVGSAIDATIRLISCVVIGRDYDAELPDRHRPGSSDDSVMA